MTSHYHDEAMREDRINYENAPYYRALMVAIFRLAALFRMGGQSTSEGLNSALAVATGLVSLPPKERYHAINAACERLVEL